MKDDQNQFSWPRSTQRPPNPNSSDATAVPNRVLPLVHDVAESLSGPDGARALQLLHRLIEAIETDGELRWLWAAAQQELGDTLIQLSDSDNGGLEGVIAAYESALSVYEPAAYAVEYGMVQNNLGNAYLARRVGDRADNVERAISAYLKALGVRTPEIDPYGWGRSQNNLGNAYAVRQRGDPIANWQLGIESYRAALEVHSIDAYPDDYAMEQTNLGLTYLDRPDGSRSADLDMAMACFVSALLVFGPSAYPAKYHRLVMSLSDTFLDRLHSIAEEWRWNAIEALRPAFDTLLEAEFGFGIQTGVPELLGIQTGVPDRQAGLRATEVDSGRPSSTQDGSSSLPDPDLWERYLQDRYRFMPLPELLNAIQTSTDPVERIRALRAALSRGDIAPVLPATAPDIPTLRASLLDELGTNVLALQSGDRIAHQEEAIKAFEAARVAFTRDEHSREWFTVHSHLAVAFGERISGSRAENVERAIDYCREAIQTIAELSRREQEHGAQPQPMAREAWAEAFANLGQLYRDRLLGDPGENYRQALQSFASALQVWTHETNPNRWARVQNSIGLTHLELRTHDLDSTESAITAFGSALTILTREDHEYEWAGVLFNMGRALMQRRLGKRADNVERAIESMTESMSIRTRERFPADWARTQHNLGQAYRNRLKGDRNSNLEKAVECFSSALEVHSLRDFPRDHRITAANLGDLHFSEGRWEEAHAAFASAVAAAELLYRVNATELGRQAELSQAGDVVGNDAYSLVRLGRAVEAVERLEGGRTRALAEALARERAALGEAREEDRVAYAAARDRIRALEAEARAGGAVDPPDGTSGRSFLELSSALAAAREELDGLLGRIRGYLPHFMAEGLSYPEIAAAASPERPLVYLLTTSWGSLALIVTAGSEQLGSEQVVWLDGFSSEALDGLLVERDPSGGVSGGYLVGQVGGDLDMLGSVLGRVLPLLGEKLLGPLTRTLGDLGVAGATLVAVGRLSLLPLPAAAEGLTFSLAPSARALRAARDAAADRAGLAPLLVAVGNPLPVPEGLAPLDYAAEEVAAIAPFFEPGSRRLLPEEQATLEGVTHGLAGATHLHLACHGSFHHDQPLDSALHLAGGERITLGDLLDGDLNFSTAHLAVLSACQTGITEFDRIPDEAVGLPAGFLQAGVPGVVATLWSVNDLSTALLMAEFYRLLLTEHLDPAAALHQARRWLADSTAADLDLAGWFDRRHQASGWTDLAALNTARYYRAHPHERPFAHPTHWAGFTYTGPQVSSP